MKPGIKAMLRIEKAQQESRNRFAPFFWIYLFGASGTALGVIDLHFAPANAIGLKFDPSVFAVSTLIAILMLSAVIRQLVDEVHFHLRIAELKRLNEEAAENNVVSLQRGQV